ncbi:hypothetical protein [Endozoicomonas numazuensis]|uniref:SAM-dependent methyltransferase n=1 Tax=Endozoicomonas numazuensis TaxID=1137799 RepID=A0A081NJU4_9GAMM|nr:hypothetical protein [Endozoicomonas numazuensis]KEQ18717.1 hypothetical protein GZ78_00970 [Endozoicomonas numazuensis]
MDGTHRATTNNFSVYVDDDDSDLYGDRDVPLKSDITRDGNDVGIQVEPDETAPIAQPIQHRSISRQVIASAQHVPAINTVEAIQFYTNAILNNEVPLISPDLTYIEKLGFTDDVKAFNDLLSGLDIWALVNHKWVSELVNWVKGNSCLEVMSGNGFLAKALKQNGVEVIATDDRSWDDPDSDKIRFYDVETLDAIDAIKKYSDKKVLIMSWPPPNVSVSYDVLKAWGSEKPVIFIGDKKGGMTACDDFYSHFKAIDEQPVKSYLPAHNAQDTVLIGYYVP